MTRLFENNYSTLQSWKTTQRVKRKYLRELKEHGAISATMHSAISKVQVESGLPNFIRSTVNSLANGDLSRVKVVEITPSRVVLMVYNKPVTTAQTRTPLTTKQETSTVSVTPATTAGTAKTTRTTTRTSRSETKKAKSA